MLTPVFLTVLVMIILVAAATVIDHIAQVVPALAAHIALAAKAVNPVTLHNHVLSAEG